MIRYRIIQDIEQLKRMSAKELIEEDEVYGFFNIKFKDSQIGDYLSERELPLKYALNNNIYLYHDCLLWWFESIYRVLRLLEQYSLVKLLDLENDIYGYIFKKNSGVLEIQGVQVEKKNTEIILINDCDYLSMEFSEKVNYYDFIDDYKSVFTSFRNELLAINQNFECIHIIREINEWIKESNSISYTKNNINPK